MANPESGRVSTDAPDLHLVFEFTIGIIDKQYRSYLWNDGKVQALITIDGALMAGLLVVFQVFSRIDAPELGLLGLSFAFLLISFFTCLVHAIPRIDSKVGNQENLRTMVGISRLTKEEYHAKATKLDLGEMVRMNCWQIAGMCRNNMRSHRLIRFGVWLTIVGTLLFAVAMPAIAFTNWELRDAAAPQQTGSPAPTQPSSSSQPSPTSAHT